MENIKEKIDNLRNKLHEHNYSYYVLSNPQISDLEFDELLSQLSELETKYPQYYDVNSPTVKIGSDINKNFNQIEHKYPMLSLQNTYSFEEIGDFYAKIKKLLNDDFKIVCELKFDGTSISIIYKNGKLSRAVTRGDGKKGDDVTNNVKAIKNIPLILKGDNIPPEIEFRGEILMPWSVFNDINKEREIQEEPLFSNPRNAASGTLKLKDSKIVANRKLESYIYYMIGEYIPTDSHSQNMNIAKNWGIPVSNLMKVCNNIEEVFEFLKLWDIKRKDLPVTTDGVVLKIDSIKQQKNLSNTNKFPRWAIAYKFNTEKKLTKLNSISYQVGRTGAITPVANLEPISISGTIVKRASLYNEDYISSLDLHLQDMVYVEKGGEIIPKITAVDKTSRSTIGEKVLFAKNCPDCGSELLRYDGEATYYCPNSEKCPTQIKGRIEHFVTRKAMNINIGTENISLLYDKGLIKDICDLYYLEYNNLISLDRWGETSARNLIESIEKSKQTPFEKVLYALGIRYVGETVSQKLANTFININNIANASIEELTKLDEIGDRIAKSIHTFFEKEDNKSLLLKLKDANLQLSLSEEKKQNKTDKLKDINIVISGTFNLHSRDEYKQYIIQNGGKNSSSISKKTNYILGGENIGVSKLEKAKNLGIDIIDEETFLNMIK